MTKAQGKAKQTLRAQRAKKQKVRTTVWIGSDMELAQRLRDAKGRRVRLEGAIAVRGDDATESDRRNLASLNEEISKLEEEARETSIKFVFEAIGRKRFEQLKNEHPPTEAQTADAIKAEEALEFNPDTFPAALIEACCVEPEREPGELEEWIRDDPDDEWNITEVQELFQAAVMVNMTAPRYDLGKG